MQKQEILTTAFACCLIGSIGLLGGCEDDDDIELEGARDVDRPVVASNSDYQNDSETASGYQDDDYGTADMDDDDYDAMPASARQDQSPQRDRQGNVDVGQQVFDAVAIDYTGADQVRAGEEYTYTVNVTNTSDQMLSNVMVMQMLPPGFELDESRPATTPTTDEELGSLAFGYQYPTGQRTGQTQDQTQDQTEQRQADRSKMDTKQWSLGTLTPGEEKSIQVTGTAMNEGTIESCLTVKYQPAICTNIQVVKPDLRLVREVPDEPVYICDEIPVTYRLTNVGSGSTQDAVIAEELPGWLQTADGSKTVSINVGPLEAGETAEEQIMLMADEGGSYSGRGIARTSEMNARSQKDPLVVLEPNIELSVDGPEEEYIDREIRYNVTVENTSDAPAIDTVVTMDRPDNTERWTYSTQRINRDDGSFNIGRLEPGESRSFNVTFNGVEPGRVYSTFTASAYCVDEKSAEIATTIRGVSAIRIDAIDLTDPVEVGGTTTYQIQVKNQGSAEELNIQLVATLPEELEFIEGAGDTTVSADGNRITLGQIDRLDPGDVLEWNIQVRARDSGKVRFQVEMTSDAQRKPVTSMEPTTVY